MARIALDIDSTLHHYWDLLDQVSRRRYGVELPYDAQLQWGITELEHEQLVECVQETHSDENILAAEPYDGAVEAVRAWHEAGHWIHVTSHRREGTRAATERWLEQIGMPCDDLHCSFDKVSRCVELGIDVLVDDSPVNLARARDEGITAATIIHPWNVDLIDSDTGSGTPSGVQAGGVVGGKDWPELAERLEPVLARLA